MMRFKIEDKNKIPFYDTFSFVKVIVIELIDNLDIKESSIKIRAFQ